MIQLSRINGESIFVNPELIRTIESRPDTLITFVDGRTILVKESPAEVAKLVIDYRRACTGFEGKFNERTT